MEIVQSIDKITAWINENVCPNIVLKLPDDFQNGAGYKVETVNPTAFPMYQPGKDKLPPNVIAPFPSVVVQLLEGSDTMTDHNRRLRLQLSFTAWNPGNHAQEMRSAVNTSPTIEENGLSFPVSDDADGAVSENTFKRDADGWKDVWNFVDRALRDIENAEYINGLRVVKELGITFGQFQEEGQISDIYPYWGAWAIFTIESGLPRIGSAYSQFL